MNNNTIWWIILILVVLLGAYFLFVNRGPSIVSPSVPTVSQPAPPAPSGGTPVTGAPQGSNPSVNVKSGVETQVPDGTQGSQGAGVTP